MDLEFTEEQLLFQQTIREFAQQTLAPIASDVDENHRFPAESIKPMAEMGLFGLGIPEEYGGTPCDLVTKSLVFLELNKVSGSHRSIITAHTCLVTPLVVKYGTQELKDRVLPKMCSGDCIGAFCLTEANAGSDAAGIQTTADRCDEGYVLNGSKTFITNAPIAGVFVVAAITDKEKGARGGVSIFAVEKDSVIGLQTGPPEMKLGLNGTPTGEVVFKNCMVPASSLLGVEGEGFKLLMQNLDGGRIAMAAYSVGLCDAALEATIKYTKERVQFGKPIAANQGVQWMLADMATRTEAARVFAFHAAKLYDQGKSVSMEAAMAKVFATETSQYVTDTAVQLHGGIGLTKSCIVERLMRESRFASVLEGTNQIQRVVISKHLLR